MIPLRPYQRLALHHIHQRLHQGEHRLYISLPTGTGKSVILAALAVHAVEQGRVLVLAHFQDLVVQLAGELTRQDLEVGLLMQGHRQIACRRCHPAIAALRTFRLHPGQPRSGQHLAH